MFPFNQFARRYYWNIPTTLIVIAFLSVCEGSANQAECYIRISTSEEIIWKNCTVRYNTEGCIKGHEYPTLENIENAGAEIHQEKYPGKFTSSLNISLRVFVSGSALILINGITKFDNMRCVTVRFEHFDVHPEEYVTLHLEGLPLSHGIYNLTGIQKQGFSNSPYAILTHMAFKVPVPVRKQPAKRDSGTDQRDCICNGCLHSYHEFFSDSGLLRFYYNLTNPSCSNFTVKLFRYSDPANELNRTSCVGLNLADHSGFDGFEALRKLTDVGPTRAASKVPIDFPNTATGCYVIRTLKGVFSRFFWLETTNYTDMELWNTTIMLTTRSADSSLEVRWSPPRFPFNFTSWSLTLWYLRDVEVHCEGENGPSKRIFTIEPEEILYTNNFIFANLTEGFYCVRLFPLDYRCPRDGCTPRSSRTVRLLKRNAEPDVEDSYPVWIIALVVAVGVIGGISSAVFCYCYQKGSRRERVMYTSVSLDHYHLEPVTVLVVWTRFVADGRSDIEPAVDAFKDLLRTYSKCKVYDYLDPVSLDKKQRQLLMSSPTDWLSAHLKNNKIKIIIIGTEGAKLRQQSCRTFHVKDQTFQPKIQTFQSCEVEDSLDSLLFPFFLRLLNEFRDLSSDYGRIFYVRFPDLMEAADELEGIVPWMRFNIPSHMRNLTLKLRGLSDDLRTDFPNPPDDKLQTLQAALTLVLRNSVDKNITENGVDKECRDGGEDHSIYRPT